jgi:hypothetical protein
VIEAIVVAEKVPSILFATGKIIARPIESVRHDGQSPRYAPFLMRPNHPQIGFALTETYLAGLADRFNAQTRLLSPKRQKAWCEKLERNVGGPLIRVKAHISPDLLRKYIQQVKTGLHGMATERGRIILYRK